MAVLALNHISKRFGRNDILKDISFKINEGEIVGFVGPNGAGKSTTMKVATGLLQPNGGTVNICGYDLKSNRESALKCLAAMIESPALYPYLSGKEHLQFIGKIRGMAADDIKRTMEFIGISDRINDKVKTYSLGMKQRLALGLCLLPKPKLLILDEPTNGLDPTGISELRNILTEYSKTKGMSILISSHNLSEIQKICNRVIFIQNGTLVSSKENLNNKNICSYKMHISDIQAVENLLNGCNYLIQHSLDESTLTITIKKNSLSDILGLLAVNKVAFTDFDEVRCDIEDDYKKIYKE